MLALIAGGAGFLGGHLVSALVEAAWTVRVMDIVAPDGHAAGAEYRVGDVRDAEAVERAMEGVDVVVHVAYAPPDWGEPALTAVNVVGTRNVLEAARRAQARRAIVVSSMVVERALRWHPISRSAQGRLLRYAATKREAEALTNAYGKNDLSTAIVRPKTFVGPGSSRAFMLIFEWLRLGRRILVLGDGSARYQVVHVRDLAEGIRLLCGSEATGVFSFGASEFGTVREDLGALVDHAGTGSELRFVPGRIARAALVALELIGVPASEWHYATAHRTDSAVDIGRARRDLGWEPRRSSVQGLVDAYDWYVRDGRPDGIIPAVHRLAGLAARFASRDV